MNWLKGLTRSQRVGVVFGATYVLIGVVGFVITSGLGFFALRGNDLVVFEINPLHNIVHLGIGAALLCTAVHSLAASRLMNRLVGGTYLLVAVLGVFLVEADTSIFRGLAETRSPLNILALNHADNLLHIASAIVLIGATLIGRTHVAVTPPAKALVRKSSTKAATRTKAASKAKAASQRSKARSGSGSTERPKARR